MNRGLSRVELALVIAISAVCLFLAWGPTYFFKDKAIFYKNKMILRDTFTRALKNASESGECTVAEVFPDTHLIKISGYKMPKPCKAPFKDPDAKMSFETHLDDRLKVSIRGPNPIVLGQDGDEMTLTFSGLKLKSRYVLNPVHGLAILH